MAKSNKKMNQNQEEEGTPIHGDILETILSHVPLVHLVSPSRVSKPWKRAVSSSLLHVNKLKPWLIIHTQSTRPPFSTTIHAYDPRSHHCIQITKPSFQPITTVRSSHSTLLYTFSSTTLSISLDPLHLSWTHLPSSPTLRTDPIIAAVGRRIIIAGGACYFEDNPPPLEIFNNDTQTWEQCNTMPQELQDIASAQWVSAAVHDNKLYMTGKLSGLTFTFDPETKNWVGPVTLQTDPDNYFYVTGFCKDRFLVVSLVGEAENLKGVRIYDVGFEDFEVRTVYEMPRMFVDMLRGESLCLWSVEVCFKEEVVFVCNMSWPEIVVVGEMCDGGWRWWTVRNKAVGKRCLVGERMVFTCGGVGVKEVEKAMQCDDVEFVVKE